MPPQITALYAGILALFYLELSRRVIASRRSGGVDMGNGGDRLLQRRQRGHANFAEYVPFALVMLALLELGGWPAWLLHLLGATLLAGRLAHAHAFSVAAFRSLPRVIGTALTLTALSALAALCLVQALR